MQSAYRPHHSTETALIRVQSDILLELDNHHCVILVLLDLSAAFDTITYSILLDLLSSRIGLTGIALDFFRSYLQNRTQSVFINGIKSKLTSLQYGVPQGSVLGPTLFTIYTLPLADLIRSHGLHYHQYADDTQLYLSFKPSDDNALSNTLAKIQKCVSHIKMWMSYNRLMLNDSKTEILILTPPSFKSKISIPKVEICNTTIVPGNSIKNLGIIFDSALNMKAHINFLCKNANFHLRNIGAIRKYITKHSCIQLVHALITARLDYANSLLFGVPDNQLNKLQRILNTAARIVSLSPRINHITPILHNLHWLPVKQRIIFKILIITFRAVHGSAPRYIMELCEPYSSQRSLRSNRQRLLKTTKTKLKTFGDRAFAASAPFLWNSLPTNFRHLENLETFKSNIKTYLFRQAYGDFS